MRVLSVNIGQPTVLSIGEKEVVSGIRKHPVPGRIAVGLLGLEGDHVLATKHHGGPDQAVYLYSAQDYDWWAERLGEALEPGTLGENLTLSSFGADQPRVGDRYQIGDVLLEVTAPRIPCDKLAARMSDPGFVKKFREARRPGLYTRVLEGGALGKDDPVTYLPAPASSPKTAELFEVFYDKQPQAETLRRLLAAPIAIRARRDYEERLAGLEPA